MTLGFSTHHSNGIETLFEQKILLPYKPELQQQYPDLLPKIHTFRLGTRWRSGMAMHMVTGDRTPQRRQFNEGIPELATCKGVQKCFITIFWKNSEPEFRIEIDNRVVNSLLFMANDGFDGPDQFFDWFGHPFKTVSHEGQLVHFSNFRYL